MTTPSSPEPNALFIGIGMGTTKITAKALFGFGAYFILPKKKCILILSAVRSGSTLLKALISEAPEIEHRNESSFSFAGNRYSQYCDLYRSGRGSIVLLKKPSEFNMVKQQFREYPQLPEFKLKGIVLYRDPGETFVSATHMLARKNIQITVAEFIDYWCTTYENLLNIKPATDFMFVSYEKILTNPVASTASIFKFIDSRKHEGVDEYTEPTGGGWEWGKDDGGELIKSKKVTRTHHDTQAFENQLHEISHNSRVRKLVLAYKALCQEPK